MHDATMGRYQFAATSSDTDGTLSSSWKRVIALSLYLLVVFYVSEHKPQFAGASLSLQDEEQVADTNVDAAEQGSRQRQIILLTFAFVGLGLLVSGGDWNYSPHRVGTFFALALLVWAAASVFWAVEPGISVRRLIAWLCFVLGCVGIARRVTSEELLRIAFITLAVFVTISFLLDLKAGAGPWQSSYRLSGTQHPNVQASYCASLAIAGFCMAYSVRPPLLGQAACVVGMLMLYFTGSRTSLLAATIAIAAVWALRQSAATKAWLLGTLVGSAGVILVAFFALPPHTQRSLTGAALLGRTEKAGTLSGRVPLWEELLDYAADKPLLGYGYDCFWIPGTIEDIHQSQKWSMTSAHNAYLEVALQLGIIGLIIASLMVLVTIFVARGRYRATGNPGHRFIYGLLLYALMNSLLEAHFVRPKFTTAIAMMGIALLLFFKSSVKEEEQTAESNFNELGTGSASGPILGGTHR